MESNLVPLHLFILWSWNLLQLRQYLSRLDRTDKSQDVFAQHPAK